MKKASGGGGIPAELSQILKDAVKVLRAMCQQIWKTQSTRLEKVHFHSNPKDRQCKKKVQTIIKLCSFHMSTRSCSKSFKLDFTSLSTEKFKIYKLGYEEAEESEIKLPTFVASWRKQGNSI